MEEEEDLVLRGDILHQSLARGDAFFFDCGQKVGQIYIGTYNSPVVESHPLLRILL